MKARKGPRPTRCLQSIPSQNVSSIGVRFAVVDCGTSVITCLANDGFPPGVGQVFARRDTGHQPRAHDPTQPATPHGILHEDHTRGPRRSGGRRRLTCTNEPDPCQQSGRTPREPELSDAQGPAVPDGVDAREFTEAIHTLVLRPVKGPCFVRLTAERRGSTVGPGTRARYRLRRDGAARPAGRSPGSVSAVLPGGRAHRWISRGLRRREPGRRHWPRRDRVPRRP